MTEQEIFGIINEPQIQADAKLMASADLFCKSLLTNFAQQGKILTCELVKRAWSRWKQERGFAPNDVVGGNRDLFKIKK